VLDSELVETRVLASRKDICLACLSFTTSDGLGMATTVVTIPPVPSIHPSQSIRPSTTFRSTRNSIAVASLQGGNAHAFLCQLRQQQQHVAFYE